MSRLSPRQIGFALALLTLALRLPFISQTLNHWDSVNHALALTSFNVAAHRPQPPGYILYIGIARLVNFIFTDAQTALVVVSMLASALAVAFLFLLGTRMASREIGFIAALLLLTSPPFWFDGEVALPYVVEGCASIVLAFLLFRLWRGEARLAPLFAVGFAIAVGMRQWMVIYFLPLVLYVYWKESWRVRLESIVWFALTSLLWFVPLIASVGGVDRYLQILRAYNAAFSSEVVIFGAGGASGLVRNLSRVAAFTLYALNLALLPILIGAGLYLPRRSARELWSDPRVRFLVWWIAPSLVFYMFVHMGSPGLIYVFLPALYLLTAVGIQKIARVLPIRRAAMVAALCAANLFIFFGTPPDLNLGREIRVLNYSAMVEHDRSLTARVNGIRANFDPATTLVIADEWRFAEYYLPNFQVLFVPPDPNDALLLSEHRQETYLRANALDVSQVELLVFFDASALRKYQGTAKECMAMQNGACLPVVHLAQKGGVKILNGQIEGRARE